MRIDSSKTEISTIQQLEKIYAENEPIEDIPIEFQLSFFDENISNGTFTLSFPLNVRKPDAQQFITTIKKQMPAVDLDAPLLSCNGNYTINDNKAVDMTIGCDVTNENGQPLNEVIYRDATLLAMIQKQQQQIANAIKVAVLKNPPVHLLVKKSNKKRH